MASNNEQNQDWELVEKILNKAKAERLEHPHSLLSPKPYHFEVGSKHTGVAVTMVGPASDPQMETLYSYGMPRIPFYIIGTLSAAIYGNEFADFTLEYFGIISEQVNVETIRERQVGQGRCLNSRPKELPLNAGMSVTLENDRGFLITILPWRWRVFMNESSLCLENLYHRAIGWIPFVLGVRYKNPEKTVADAARFAPAFRIGNLIDAQIGERRGGDTRAQEIQQMWSNEEVLKRYALLVDELAPVWTTIKGLAHHCDSEESQKEWVTSVLERRAIKNLVAEYSKLTEDVLRRAVDNTLNKIDREPRLLAYFHAALELDVNINGETLSVMDAYLKYEDKPPAPSTLKTPYDKGKALLKQSE